MGKKLMDEGISATLLRAYTIKFYDSSTIRLLIDFFRKDIKRTLRFM
jgi:hypothetical protein